MPKFLILGCGGPGCKFVSNMSLCSDVTVLTINDSDSDIVIGEQHGFHGDSKSACDALMNYCESLIDLFSDYTAVFSMSSLGGAIGTGSIEAISKCAYAANVPYIPLVTLPFVFETERRKKAWASLWRLPEISDRAVVFDLQMILKTLPDISFESVSELIGLKMVHAVEIFMGLLPRIPFFSTFEFGLYTISYALTTSTIRSVEEAVSNPLFDVKPDDAKLIICMDGRPEEGLVDYLREKVTGMTGICPDIIPGSSEILHGVTVFLPIVFRHF